jgi:hypothetical protein
LKECKRFRDDNGGEKHVSWYHGNISCVLSIIFYSHSINGSRCNLPVIIHLNLLSVSFGIIFAKMNMQKHYLLLISAQLTFKKFIMKTKYVFILAIIIFAFTGCDTKDSFVDLETGKTITVVKDSTSGYMINAETKQPVEIYVNTATHDTIYGRTGKVINNLVARSSDGKFTYHDHSEMKVTDGGSEIKVESDADYKKKVEKDGDVKIKDGDTKIKIEADGDKKIKKD